MFEKLEKCPVCKNKTSTNYIICKDHMITNESFAITKCDKCDFLFTNPRPVKEKLQGYYESKDYISHSNTSNNLTNLIYKVARSFTLRSKLKLVNSITSSKSILDFGCGTGHFLNTCKNNGWKIFGFEPNENAALVASDLLNSSVIQKKKDLKNIPKVDLITLWHVLEHIPDLNKTFKKIITTLKPKGKILIAVPNVDSLDAEIYKEFWAAYDVPRHLYHFNQKTMNIFLKKHNLKLKKIVPMKLDSYYVSLLSEKYKNGSSNFIKSFLNGYKSNSYAKRNHNNYSSLIYIAEL